MVRVLLVDDSALDRRFAEEILQSAGHDVVLAEDGRAALKVVRDAAPDAAPDIVLTDMQMPNLDGLGLVTTLQIDSPSLPVILMTAHGSEDLANQALRNGAASYVAKSDLPRLLNSTIDDIVAVVRKEQSYDRLISFARRAAFRFELDNDPELIEPLVDLIQQMIASVCDIDETERLRTGVALEAAISNAVYRGNLEIEGPINPLEAGTIRTKDAFRARRARIVAEIEANCIRFEVSDDGAGFDPTKFGVTAGALSEGGRGIVLMRALMDEVAFSRDGRTVHMIKRVESPAQPVAAAPVTLATLKAGYAESIDITVPRVNVGRDRSCEVVLAFSDVSGHHCQFFLHQGWWFVKDLKTKNGTRVNGKRVSRKRVNPGDQVSIAKHAFTLEYDPVALGAVGPTPPPDPWSA